MIAQTTPVVGASLLPGSPPPVGPLWVGPPPAASLVGRSTELGALDAFLRDSAANGAAHILVGQAGTGKTELLTRAAAAATSGGFRALHCTGVRGCPPHALTGLREILWPLLGNGGPLPRQQRRTLETALLDGPLDCDQRVRLTYATLAALAACASDQPLMVTVDDWDALDRETQDILAFVATRAHGSPRLGLLIATRPCPATSSLTAVNTLTLAPLDPAASHSLLTHRRPGMDPEARQHVLRTAAGNPLALLELPADTDLPAPALPRSSDRLAAALAPRASLLPQASRDLLLIAALRPDADLPQLLSAAQLLHGGPINAAALTAAETAGLLRADGNRLVFPHPATAGAAVHGTDAARCRRAHRAWADTLPDGDPAQLWHLSQATDGPDDQLAARLSIAGAHGPRHTTDDSVRLLHRAAQLDTSPTRQGHHLLLAAQCAADLGRPHLAQHLAHDALKRPLSEVARLHAQALATDDPTLHLPAPHHWPLPTTLEERDNALELTLAYAAHNPEPGHADSAVGYLDRLRGTDHDPRHICALASLAPERRAATVLSRLDKAQPSTAPHTHDVELLARAAYQIGDPLRALDLARQAETRHRFAHTTDQLPSALLQQTLAYLALGDWGQSQHTAQTCARLAQTFDLPTHAAAGRLLAQLATSLRNGQAPSTWSAGDTGTAMTAVPDLAAVLSVGRASVQVEGGHFDAAYTALLPLLTGRHTPLAHLAALIPFAEAAAQTGARAEARNALAHWQRHAAVDASPLVGIQLLFAHAVLAEDADAEPLFAQALATDLTRWPWTEAVLRLAHGRWLRRRHQAADSRFSLRRALVVFTLLGADARTTDLAQELRASGERADGDHATTPAADIVDLLSPQELTVARLAADGLSNREIGEQLHLSPRTIGSHLYRIFPRLGITSRAQLAACLTGRR